VERRFEPFGCGERSKNAGHHVDLRRLVVNFVAVAAVVMETLRLVPGDRVVKQVEVCSGELADQLDRVTLVLLQRLSTRRYLYH